MFTLVGKGGKTRAGRQMHSWSQFITMEVRGSVSLHSKKKRIMRNIRITSEIQNQNWVKIGSHVDEMKVNLNQSHW